MSINKNAIIKLETSSSYKRLTDLNVEFYTYDINTSKLSFVITRNQHPLILGVDDTKGLIDLEFSDGSLVRDKLTLVDGMKGVMSYTLTNEQLRHDGRVKGQVSVGVVGKDDTVVQRMFSFNISKMLIDNIDSISKLIEIKTFADLEKDINNRYKNMEEKFSNAENLAQAVEKAANAGLTTLENHKNDSISAINIKTNDSLNLINQASNKFNENYQFKDEILNKKISDFKKTIDDITPVSFEQTNNWQKFSLTNTDGSAFYKENINVISLPTGQFEVSNNNYMPDNERYIVNVNTGSNTSKVLIAIRLIDNIVFYKTVDTKGGEGAWEQIAFIKDISDFDKIENVDKKISDTLNESKKYTDTKFQSLSNDLNNKIDNNQLINESKTKVLFSGSINGKGTVLTFTDDIDSYRKLEVYGTVIDDNPFMVETVYNGTFFNVRTHNIYDDGTGALFYETIIGKTSELNTFVVKNTSTYNAKTLTGDTTDGITINKIVGVK